MRQLDSLRAIAVIFVLFAHWLSYPMMNYLDLGKIGVNIFFILSGFLITTILLKNRQVESKIKTLKNFYIRRFLRIFPLYYSLLIILFILGFETVRKTFFWNIFYLTNILTFINGTWSISISHFWSLSMEEQFYLIWPCFILFIPYRYLLRFIVLIICISALTRIILYSFHFSYISIDTFPLCTMDFLGFGALLAYFKENGILINRQSIVFNILAIISFFLYSLILFLIHKGFHNLFLDVLKNSLLMLCLGWIVFKASIGFTGIIGKILNYEPIVYIGKISYGLYLLHSFMPNILNYVLLKLGASNLEISKIPKTMIYFALLVIISSFSWFFYEKPFLKLKERFL